MADTTDFFNQIKTIGVLVLGAVILGIHVVLFRLNQYMFTVIMCLYILGYTILVIVLMYKNKNCYVQSDFKLLLNMSVYTLFLELFLILLSLGFMFYKSSSRR
jgi:hypothetical protein